MQQAMQQALGDASKSPPGARDRPDQAWPSSARPMTPIFPFVHRWQKILQVGQPYSTCFRYCRGYGRAASLCRSGRWSEASARL